MELQHAVKLGIKQQDELSQLSDQLDAMKHSAKQGAQDRQLWLSQLSSAERIAQDSRSALVRDQVHCEELSHALAAARSEMEALRDDKCLAETRMSKTCVELANVQEALRACEADLELARPHNREGSWENHYQGQIVCVN